jgi:hypothetical protein
MVGTMLACWSELLQQILLHLTAAAFSCWDLMAVLFLGAEGALLQIPVVEGAAVMQ